MSETRSMRPPVVPPLMLKKISETTPAGRTVGAKAALSPHHHNLVSPPGTANVTSQFPPKRRRASSKEFVHDLLAELQREHVYGPNKIIVGGNVERVPSASATPRRMSTASLSSPVPPHVRDDDCRHVETVFRNPPAPDSTPETKITPRCVKSVENTPRTIFSSGSNTPRSLFLEIDGSDCSEIFEIPMPCLQVRRSSQNTQTESQETRSTSAQTDSVQSECQTTEELHTKSIRAGPRQTEEAETQTSLLSEDDTHTETVRVTEETQTDAQDESDEITKLQRRVLDLEEERKLKYEKMKATALEEVMDLMTQMQRSHDEVEQMFSARIEELEERLREKEEECLELESAVTELDTITEQDKRIADQRMSAVESRLDSVSSSLFLRRSVFSEVVSFIASRTMRIATHRRFSSSLLLSPGGNRFGHDCAPRSSYGAILSAFSISVVGAIEMQSDSTNLPADTATNNRRPYMSYLVRCVITDENDAEEEEECELCVLRRFSEIAALHLELVQKLGKDALRILPSLPPKRWWGVRSERVVKERAGGLNTMLQALPAACWREDDAAEAVLQFLLGRKEDVLPLALEGPLAAALAC